MSVVSVTLKRGAAALLVMACAGAALAAPPASEREFIARAKAIKARTGALDSVNPVLTSFDLSGSVNTAASNQQVLATLNVTDDLSGVSSVWISLTAPSGRNVVQRYFEIVPTTATTLKVSLGPGSGPSDMGFGPWVEQGTWTVASVLLADLAGNFGYYSAADLAAMGGVVTAQVKSKSADLTAPTMTSGKLLDTKVSLSKSPAGTSGAPLVRATMALTDAGNGGLSGVKTASLLLCHVNDRMVCLSLNGSVAQTGQGDVSLRVVGRPSNSPGGDFSTGDYEVVEANIADYAGNTTMLSSTKYGGSTDFATLFPRTVVTFVP